MMGRLRVKRSEVLLALQSARERRHGRARGGAEDTIKEVWGISELRGASKDVMGCQAKAATKVGGTMVVGKRG